MAMKQRDSLLPPEFVHDLRNRWDHIQTGFVDEARTAVKQVDELPRPSGNWRKALLILRTCASC